MSSVEIDYTVGPLLKDLRSVEQVRELSVDQLTELCDEIRDYLIDLMAKRGGYLGSNLGVVELSAALHHVFETPKDRLVWDAGHQLLPHFILTGRREQLETQPIIPYHIPSSPEDRTSLQEYDIWQPGHASRSLSAALGLATGSQIRQDNRQTIALIGDASIAAGLAFEAMNHAGGLDRDLLIILNDNNRSIDPNVGALNEYLAEITSSQTFNKLRDEIYDLLGYFRSAGHKMRKAAARLEKAVMAAATPGSLFDALGLKYYGPIDGHNPQTLIRHLNDMKNVSGPKLLHVVTVKGKGFAPAVRNPKMWKGVVAPFDRISGKPISGESEDSEPDTHRKTTSRLYSKAFADILTDLAEQHEEIVGVTPSVFDEAGLQHFRDAFPNRAFQLGLSEGHASTFAAGLADSGLYPVLCLQASLLPRALDSLIHDWTQLGVQGIISLEDAGLAHNKGAAYHSLRDIAMVRSLSGVTVASPSNVQELRGMVHTAYKHGGLWIIRGSRWLQQSIPEPRHWEDMSAGKMRLLREGESAVILSLGNMAARGEIVANNLRQDGIYLGHWDARFIHPLHSEQLQKLAEQYKHWFTLEEGLRSGGYGSAVMEWLQDHHKYEVRLHRYGFGRSVPQAGDRNQLLEQLGFSPTDIAEWIKSRMK